MVVTMRKLCALPSKPSGRPRRSRATRSSTCSPRCPKGGCPRSWASAAASTTSGSQPRNAAIDEATSGSQLTRSAMARATCATCRLCVSRLCTSRPAPAGLTTCVTPASRAKNGEAAIRSRSTRNGLAARPTPDSATHDRRAARASSSTPRRLSRPSRRGADTDGVIEVLVVGGGPAGRALAAECAARGLTTTLVDPAPHAPWRATYGAWLDELPADLPPPAATARGRVVAVTSHELDRTYAVLDVPALRDHLDTRLAAAGVRTVTGRVVGTVDGGRAVLLADGTCLDADVLVDAGGHRAPLSNHADRRRAPHGCESGSHSGQHGDQVGRRAPHGDESDSHPGRLGDEAGVGRAPHGDHADLL